jgi:hypothetical protein
MITLINLYIEVNLQLLRLPINESLRVSIQTRLMKLAKARNALIK